MGFVMDRSPRFGQLPAGPKLDRDFSFDSIADGLGEHAILPSVLEPTVFWTKAARSQWLRVQRATHREGCAGGDAIMAKQSTDKSTRKFDPMSIPGLSNEKSGSYNAMFILAGYIQQTVPVCVTSAKEHWYSSEVVEISPNPVTVTLKSERAGAYRSGRRGRSVTDVNRQQSQTEPRHLHQRIVGPPAGRVHGGCTPFPIAPPLPLQAIGTPEVGPSAPTGGPFLSTANRPARNSP
jgi:hypothetical protein